MMVEEPQSLGEPTSPSCANSRFDGRLIPQPPLFLSIWEWYFIIVVLGVFEVKKSKIRVFHVIQHVGQRFFSPL